MRYFLRRLAAWTLSFAVLGFALQPILHAETIGLSGTGSVSSSAITGTATNDNAAAGKIGEVISASLASGSATSLVTGTAKTITSVSLTAGDWDCRGVAGITGNALTTVTSYKAGVSSTADTIPAETDFSYESFAGGTIFVTLNPQIIVPTVRKSIASTTTIYLVGQGVFATNSMSGFGSLVCRRAR